MFRRGYDDDLAGGLDGFGGGRSRDFDRPSRIRSLSPTRPKLAPRSYSRGLPPREPSPRRRYGDSAPLYRPRDLTPPRRFRDLSPSRRLRDLTPPRRFRDLTPPRRYRDLTPPRRYRDLTPPRRYRDLGPPERFHPQAGFDEPMSGYLDGDSMFMDSAPRRPHELTGSFDWDERMMFDEDAGRKAGQRFSGGWF